jgi:hypothetical protein
MTKKTNVTTAADWFRQDEDKPFEQDDLRLRLIAKHRTETICRFAAAAPHGLPDDFAEMLKATAKLEPHKFSDAPYSPEVRAEKLKGMTAQQRHEESNRGRK